jgi:Family of unknown function (DUF6152)
MKVVVLLFAGLLLVLETGFAHHGVTSYDMEKQVEATGTVKEWYWGYPHTLLTINVSNAAGKPEEWILESGPPGVMTEAGWSKTSWKAGEKVSVKLHPRRKEPKGGLLVEAQRANGQVLKGPKPPE